jgi:hypothetical protein
MEGVPPGGIMQDQHQMMLEEKVCKQPEHIHFVRRSIYYAQSH